MSDKDVAREEVEHFQKKIGALREEIGRVIVGNRDVVDGVLTCMLAGSHALLEGVPEYLKSKYLSPYEHLKIL